MKQIIFTLTLLSVYFAPSFAQSRVVENQSVSFNLLGAEYNIEKPIGKLSTIVYHGGLASEMGFSFSSYTFGDETENDDEWYYSLRATVGAQYRCYYNLNKRAEKGKSTYKNSANFWAIGLQYYTPGIISHNMDTEHIVLLTPSWGLRRVNSKNWYLEFNPGLSFGIDGYDDFLFGPNIIFKVGCIF